ncbi:MAG: hypothetical protein BYD32DRAFT_404794 [Podila humilis]|nr:MAG: hypothetical protein BYD32DRAFT_404794 [Podila humilis]
MTQSCEGHWCFLPFCCYERCVEQLHELHCDDDVAHLHIGASAIFSQTRFVLPFLARVHKIFFL